MTPDLEEMIRHRAHEIWEEEGRPHGRHEEHWQRAAGEITEELERIKAAHTPATAEEIEAPAAPRRGRPRKTDVALSTKQADSDEVHRNAPRKRGRKAAGETQPEAAPVATTARRIPRGADGAQSEPATEAAPKHRRKKSEAAEVGPETEAAIHPARRGRKPKVQPDTPH